MRPITRIWEKRVFEGFDFLYRSYKQNACLLYVNLPCILYRNKENLTDFLSGCSSSHVFARSDLSATLACFQTWTCQGRNNNIRRAPRVKYTQSRTNELWNATSGASTLPLALSITHSTGAMTVSGVSHVTAPLANNRSSSTPVVASRGISFIFPYL